MDQLASLAELLGIRGLVVLELPARSRRPSRLASRLRFARAHGWYWIGLCRGLECGLCGFPEEPVVRVERVVARDVLSDLVHRVPRIVVECCGERVGVGEWRGSWIVLEGLECRAWITGRGGVCGGRSCGGPRECLRVCVTRGPLSPTR